MIVLPQETVEFVASAEPREARSACNNITVGDKKILIFLTNEVATTFLVEALTTAAVEYKKRGLVGDNDRVEAIKSLVDKIRLAVVPTIYPH
jgi:hypothetical protein